MNIKLPGATLVYLLIARLTGILVLLIVSFFINIDGLTVDPMVVRGGILALGALVIIQTILYYSFFSYSATDKNITVNSGIIFRQSKSIDFNRIQNVNNTRGPLQMLFGLTEVQIWTASQDQVNFSVTSSSNGIAKISAKPKPEADLIIFKEIASALQANLMQRNTGTAPIAV